MGLSQIDEEIGKLYLQVVGVEVVELNVLELSRLGIMEVETGKPVGTVVTLDHGVTALGLQEVLSSGARAETASTHDVVNVRGSLPREENRIHATSGKLLVGEAQDSESALILGGRSSTGKKRGGGDKSRLHDDDNR